MTKLQKLYSTIQNLKELGLELGDELLKQTSELSKPSQSLFTILS